MEEERSIDKLARYTLAAATILIAAGLFWYFRSVLVYIILAFIVSLIGLPLMRLMRKIRIKGKPAPDSVLAIISIILIMSLLSFIVTQIVPVVVSIIGEASAMDSRFAAGGLNPLEGVNDYIIATIPSVGPDFRLEKTVLDGLKGAISLKSVGGAMSSIIGSVASIVTTIVVGLFSVIFISFFFLKDEFLFDKIVASLVPDRIEDKILKALEDIKNLLSRYFGGVLIEMLGVALLDFLLLWGVARLGVGAALGIAFIAGLLNIIPYVGPLIGEAIGVILAVILKFGTGVGLPVSLWAFALIVLALMLTTQLIDNFIYQPLIYSTSIKAGPLEIFIVLLIAGTIGGVVGMLAAIPAYTVIRVIASRFFHHLKPVKRLIPDTEGEV
ncbi:MAG: AI-2E family transporter [Bacteroidales bacterium]|nr:AI-2E family transporter [Bacteroidales bacterium]